MDATLLETDCPGDLDLRDLVLQMREEISQLQRTVCQLRCDVGYWKNQHANACRRIEKLQTELAAANAEVRKLKGDLYGQKSEKQRSPDHSHRCDQLEDSPPATKKRKRGQQADRPGPPRRDYSHLPVREEFVELPPEAQVCDCCGKPVVATDETEDCEQLEVEQIVYRRRIRRRRYRKTCQCAGRRKLTAPAPPKLIPKSRYGTSLWVRLLLEKFAAARPIQRSLQQLGWDDLSLAAGTVTEGLRRLEPLLAPIYAALKQRSTQSALHHADETRWQVFTEKQGEIAYSWWLWVFAGEDAVVYLLDPSRSHEVPQGHFGDDARGVLVVDRYAGYKAMRQVKQGQIVLAFCWAHVRRDFIRVAKGDSKFNEWTLTWLRPIRTLYQLHRARKLALPDSGEFAEADVALRAHVAAMCAQRDAQLDDAELDEPCRKTLVSLREHWIGLTRFLDEPQLPLDNNFAERLMRGPALGRKSYYGSAAEWSARLATTMFSIFATLKLAKLNPQRWLTWYLATCAQQQGRTPADIQPFLPWNLSPQRRAELAAPAIPRQTDTS